MFYLLLSILAVSPSTPKKISLETRKAFMDSLKVTGDEIAVIQMAKGAKIYIKLYPEYAPNTVKNFIMLSNLKFYDGLTFHRVIPKFMAQGGCPIGNGTGDAGYNLKAEFNERRHLTGTVAMARAQDPNSASSQFYICFAPQPHLDKNYTVFGQVIKGMDVVNGIKKGSVMDSVRIVAEDEIKDILYPKKKK